MITTIDTCAHGNDTITDEYDNGNFLMRMIIHIAHMAIHKLMLMHTTMVSS